MIHIRRLYGYVVVFFTRVNIFGVLAKQYRSSVQKNLKNQQLFFTNTPQEFCGVFLSKDERSQKTSQ